MKLILDINQLDEAPARLLKQAGYAYLMDRNTGQDSFVRPFYRGYYPRFHLYLKERNGKIILNLHLDQKQASYEGASAHNAEYDGEVVAAEMARIRQLAHNAQRLTQSENEQGAAERDVLDKIRPKHFEGTAVKAEKKSWWSRLFE